MHLVIFSPGKVTPGFANDDATDRVLYDMLFTAATKEQGNGKPSSQKGRGERMGREDSR